MKLEEYVRRFDEAIHAPSHVTDARELFTALAADRRALRAVLAKLLERLAHDPLFLSQSVAENQIVLSPLPRPEAHYDLALGRYRQASASVLTHCVHGLIAPLAAPIRIEHYRLPDGWDSSVFSADVRLERLDDFEVRTGEALAIAPGRDAYRVRVQRPTLVLKLVSRPVSAFEWSFEERGLCAWQSISTIPAETHLVHACRAAAALGERSLVEPLARLTRHARHIVRWEAVRSLCLLDRRAGLAELEGLCDDSHPHVHRAARRARDIMMREAA